MVSLANYLVFCKRWQITWFFASVDLVFCKRCLVFCKRCSWFFARVFLHADFNAFFCTRIFVARILNSRDEHCAELELVELELDLSRGICSTTELQENTSSNRRSPTPDPEPRLDSPATPPSMDMPDSKNSPRVINHPVEPSPVETGALRMKGVMALVFAIIGKLFILL